MGKIDLSKEENRSKVFFRERQKFEFEERLKDANLKEKEILLEILQELKNINRTLKR